MMRKELLVVDMHLRALLLSGQIAPSSEVMVLSRESDFDVSLEDLMHREPIVRVRNQQQYPINFKKSLGKKPKRDLLNTTSHHSLMGYLRV
ncbi:hypothetical protein ISS07_00125 [Candidatus Woesearchaeota archaeon]|nr:hypothetical protein [Candidatus Woesearchaeota archaeon]